MADVFATLLSDPDRVPQIVNIAVPNVVGMDELLIAAGIDYHPRPAPAGAIPVVALCTEMLETLYEFDPRQSHPATMVGEWQKLKDRL